MSVSLRGRDFVTLADYTREEIEQVLDAASMMKLRMQSGMMDRPLAGKTLGMIFTKPSTRTRISFEVGIWQLGGVGLFLSSEELQLRRGETIEDTARVLSRYLDGIMIRTYSHQDVVDLARYSQVPVINGLTDLFHPCQAAADLLTMREKKGELEGLRLAFAGDGGSNMVHSLLYASAKTGMDMVVGCPSGYEPDGEVLSGAEEVARSTGSHLEVVHDAVEAVSGADVVYGDVWISMGDEREREERMELLSPYRIDGELWSHTAAGSIFMHCLPAHRGEEVTAEVMDGPSSVVFDQAENRLHVQKAIMSLLM